MAGISRACCVWCECNIEDGRDGGQEDKEEEEANSSTD